MSYIIDKRTAMASQIGESPYLAVRTPVIGRSFLDPSDKGRSWVVSDILLQEESWQDPNAEWKGVIFRCFDHRGTVGFIDQEELEVCFRYANPGEQIPWAPEGQRYTHPINGMGIFSDRWTGSADLYLRECLLRTTLVGKGERSILTAGTTLNRTLKESDGREYNEAWSCKEDAAPSGMGPDPDFRGLYRRWTKVRATLL